MKKSIKQSIEGIIISLTTLVFGGVLTGVTFNLFGELTRTQLRIFFACDIAIMLTVGAIAFLIYESRENKKYREDTFQERHNKRVQKQAERMNGIEELISLSDYAA